MKVDIIKTEFGCTIECSVSDTEKKEFATFCKANGLKKSYESQLKFVLTKIDDEDKKKQIITILKQIENGEKGVQCESLSDRETFSGFTEEKVNKVLNFAFETLETFTEEFIKGNKKDYDEFKESVDKLSFEDKKNLAYSFYHKINPMGSRLCTEYLTIVNKFFENKAKRELEEIKKMLEE